ncbi:MAG: PilZ domain-containing protein [Magnetococcus sp. DMHC-6]
MSGETMKHRAVRLDYVGNATFFSDAGEKIPGHVINFSVSGFFMEIEKKYIHEHLFHTFGRVQVNTRDRSIDIRCQIVRVDADGLGFQFE